MLNSTSLLLSSPVISDYKFNTFISIFLTFSKSFFSQYIQTYNLYIIYFMIYKELQVYKHIQMYKIKTIGETSFSTKKLRPQKKSGRARVSSRKSSFFKKGGGKIFGPTTAFKSIKINKKEWKNSFLYLLYIYKSFILCVKYTKYKSFLLTLQYLYLKYNFNLIKNSCLFISTKYFPSLKVEIINNKCSFIQLLLLKNINFLQHSYFIFII